MKVTINLDEVSTGNLVGTKLHYKLGLHQSAADSETFVQVPAGQSTADVELDNDAFYTLTAVSTYTGDEGQVPSIIETASLRVRTSPLMGTNRAQRVMAWVDNVAFMGAIEDSDVVELRSQLMELGVVESGTVHNVDIMPLHFYIDGRHYMTHVTHTSSYAMSGPSNALQNADRNGVRYTVAGRQYRCDWQEAPQKAALAMYEIYRKSGYNPMIHQRLGFNTGGTTDSSGTKVYLASDPNRTTSTSNIPSMQTLFVTE